jgi:sugar phosphate isomerase/epimerase
MNRRELLKTMPALAAALQAPARAAAAPAGDKARLRSAICAYSFRDALKKQTMNYDDLVRLAVDLNVDGLDLTVYWFPNTSNEFLLPLRRLAYRSAVELYSISIRSEMTQPTAELRAKEVAELKKWVDAAATLGAGHIRVFGGRVPKNASEEQAAGWVVDVLKRGGEYAGTKGVILGLENHGGITEKADTILSIVKQVDSPWVAINLDTGNFNRNAYEQIQECMPYSANVQVKMDIRTGDAGTREPSDWERICRMLVAAKYKGYLALEYEAREDPAIAMPREMKKLNSLVRKYSV